MVYLKSALKVSSFAKQKQYFMVYLKRALKVSFFCKTKTVLYSLFEKEIKLMKLNPVRILIVEPQRIPQQRFIDW